MRTVKRCTVLLVATIFTFLPCMGAFAAPEAQEKTAEWINYEVPELEISVMLPETWKVLTRTNFDMDYVGARFGLEDEKAWENYASSQNLYLYATVVNYDGQYEILITHDESNGFEEEINYSNSYMWALESTAKASYKANKESGDSYRYKSYDVVEGNETNYLVFDYSGSDPKGNATYGKLYHTFEGGRAIDFDISAYEALSADFEAVFDGMVLNVKYTGEYDDSTAILKLTLKIAALGALAVAFVTVIVIFIVSKSKEKKQLKAAVSRMNEELAHDAEAAAPLSETDTEQAVQEQQANSESKSEQE